MVRCDHLSLYDFWNKPEAEKSRKKLPLPLNITNNENGMLCGGVVCTFQKKC